MVGRHTNFAHIVLQEKVFNNIDQISALKKLFYFSRRNHVTSNHVLDKPGPRGRMRYQVMKQGLSIRI